MSERRVVVAMSGGVDSSVAAALLVQAGYRVEGIMLELWSEPAVCGPGNDASVPTTNRCCTPDQMADAREVARILHIPFQTWDLSTPFRDTVVEDMISAYSAGLTPNPCLVCNRRIRFGLLLERAREMGFDAMATGHYVRLSRGEDSTLRLLTGIDGAKDQSYVLHMLSQTQLGHLLFPVGGYTKPRIRELARQFDLPVATKPDSQDLCFLIDGDYRRFLRENAPEAMRPGPILDQNGRTLGTHQGTPGFTIGQRKGLGISAPRPLYVLEIDPARNALIVGDQETAGRRELTTTDTHWVAGRPPGGGAPFSAEVRIRYKGSPRPALVTPGPNAQALVRFQGSISDISPGQAAVFYQGEVCLGGGTITRQEPVA